MKIPAKVIVAALSLCMYNSCDDAFNPNGVYKEKMIVYAVLSSLSDTQYVRVYTTYPVTNDPLSITTDTSVPDARVTITHDVTSFQFRDTTLQRSDTSRYHSGIKARVAYKMRLEGGELYTLSVVSPTYGTITARGTALYSGGLISVPDFNGNVVVLINPASNAHAFILRMFLEYEVFEGNVWVTKRIEIPRTINVETGEFIYPKPVSREVGSVTFSIVGYDAVRSQLRQQNPGGIRMKRTVFYLTQLDEALYAYYSTANGFPDSGTLRLDEPDYSNIDGGLGVFAMTSTTIVVADTTGSP